MRRIQKRILLFHVCVSFMHEQFISKNRSYFSTILCKCYLLIAGMIMIAVIIFLYSKTGRYLCRKRRGIRMKSTILRLSFIMMIFLPTCSTNEATPNETPDRFIKQWESNEF